MANYVLLGKIELTSATASVTFANITQTGYTDLKIVCSSISNKTGQYDEYVRLSFNGVTTNQSARILYGVNGTTAGSQTATAIYGATNADTSTSSTFGLTEFYIPNYNQATSHPVSIEGLSEGNATASIMQLVAGLWNPGTPAAITSITLSPNEGTSWLSNSVFSLYGVSSSGTTPSFSPQAFGGNTITTDGTYWYHTFLSSGIFTPLGGLTVDALVIAGGGGGGSTGVGGGGGAGGVLSFTSQSVTATNYTVTVGSGGSVNMNGSDSQFGSLTTVKGGGYGSTSTIGGTGGSGGGGGISNGTGGSPTSGQGYAGGNGFSSGTGTTRGAGGGGGAGAAGSNGASGVGGAGGAGLNTWSSWASATSTGSSGYYAGGGGGGSSAGSGTYSGGAGGGGTGSGSGSVNGTAGSPNTGSGGGGAGTTSGVSNSIGGNGGSGLVIVRYAV